MWAEFEQEAICCLEALHADQVRVQQAPGKPARAFATLEELQARKDSAVHGYLPAYWGYDFAAAPSSSEPEKRYWAVAHPTDGRGKHFFLNQEGRVHAGAEPFEVDRESCRVPDGLKPVTRDR